MTRLNTLVALVLLASPAQADPERGTHEFARYCASCHGYAGDGNGTNAHQFNAAATDFGRGVYKCRSTPTGTLPTDEDLRRSITRGLTDSGMPSFVALGAMQIDDLVATLKMFSSRFAHEPIGKPISVTAATPNDAASRARGAASWSRLKCDGCHGNGGRGPAAAAATLHNDDGSELHIPDLTRGPAYKCGDDDVRVFTSIMTGLDGTPMVGFAGAATPADAWDLVHFLARLRH